MTVSNTIKEVCRRNGFSADGIKYAQRFNGNDDVVGIDVGFWVKGANDEAEIEMIELFPDTLESAVEREVLKHDLIPTTRPVVHITEDDYRYIAGEVLEQGYREIVQITALVEIRKPEGVFVFEITTKSWEVDRMTWSVYDDEGVAYVTDFDSQAFYGFLDQLKRQTA